MTNLTSKFLAATIVFASPVLLGQATESSITKQLQNLGAMPGPPPMMGGPAGAKPTMVPDAQRPAVIIQTAKDIRALPAGDSKVKLADALARGSVQGQNGKEAMQAAADTLAQAVSETPQPDKDGQPAKPYMDLARLTRYAGVMAAVKDPQVVKADQVLVANDADVAKADFTLKDVNGKKLTFSSLKGKIVLVNFWSGPAVCKACAKEMTDLDLIYTHYESQGLVILSVLSPTPDDVFSLNHFLMMGAGYHPRVLLDDGGKVAKMFHVDSQPKTFVFDRDGKLVAESIDTCTQMQFFAMLAAGGLHP